MNYRQLQPKSVSPRSILITHPKLISQDKPYMEKSDVDPIPQDTLTQNTLPPPPNI